jgi:hypothetical protein
LGSPSIKFAFQIVDEISPGGIIVIGGDTTDSNFLTSLYWLPHAEAEWQELPQKLAYGRDLVFISLTFKTPT